MSAYGKVKILMRMENFYDKEIGRHLRYVGNHDEAFLVELKSGKKYVLSCENSGRVIELVRDKLRAY